MQKHNSSAKSCEEVGSAEKAGVTVGRSTASYLLGETGLQRYLVLSALLPLLRYLLTFLRMRRSQDRPARESQLSTMTPGGVWTSESCIRQHPTQSKVPRYGYCVLQLSGQQLRVDANGVGSRKKTANICTSFACIAASPGTGLPAYDSDAADCAIDDYLRHEYRWLLQTLNRSCSF